MSELYGEPFDRDSLRRLTGHPHQVVGAELVESLDGEARGQRFVRMRAGDIDCDVAVDRGLDLARLSFRGPPVHWTSPAGQRSALALEPDAMEPQGWGEVRTWPGGMLSTFGYDHVGVPAVYPHRHGHPAISAVRSPIHGRSSYSPTYLQRHGLVDDNVVVEGEVRQAAPFAEHLVLHRRIRVGVGTASVHIEDTIRNDGYLAEPVQVLYHFNFGWPLLGPGTQLRMTPQDVVAMTDEAADEDPFVNPPQQRGAVERVWDRTCSSRPQWAAIVNEDAAGRGPMAAVVEWSGQDLNHLLQWRITGQSMYALGLEPSTTGLRGPEDPGENAELPWVEPGQSRSFTVNLRFESGSEALARLRDPVERAITDQPPMLD